MAVLSNADRAAVWEQLMSELSQRREHLGVLKGEGRTVLNAMDQWISDNMASFNAAVPQPARSVLTSNQKEEWFTALLHRRREVS